MAIELEKQSIDYKREKEIPIYYAGFEVGTRRADFIVEEKVMVELKAIIQLEDVHLAQGLNYLTAYNLDKGLLINFGSTSFQGSCLKLKGCSGNINLDNLKIRQILIQTMG